MMKAMTKEERQNVKAVYFIASPINGSDSVEEIKEDLRPFIGPTMPFMDNFGVSMLHDEFCDHFFYEGFPLSNASKPFNYDENPVDQKDPGYPGKE